MKHFSNINLNLNELQNAVIQNLNTVPITASIGQIYYDTIISKLKLYTTAGWVVISTGSSGIVGPGTINRVSKFTTTSSVGDSLIEDNASSVIVNRGTGFISSYTFDVNGTIFCDYGTNNVINVPSAININMPYYNLVGGTPDACIININGKGPLANGYMTGYNVQVSGPNNAGFFGDFSDTSATSIGIRLDSRPLHTGDFVNYNKYIGATPTIVHKIDNTGNITSASYIKTGGTALEYLMADGSVTIGGGLQDLDSVLFIGNVSQIDAFVGNIGLYNNHAPSGNGYVSITGSKNIFHFYNNIGTEYAQISQDTLTLLDSSSPLFAMGIKKPATITSTRIATFQDASGTVAYLSNIPSVTGFVPYIGATQAVNLGSQSLYADGIGVGTTLNNAKVYIVGSSGYGGLGFATNTLNHGMAFISTVAMDTAIAPYEGDMVFSAPYWDGSLYSFPERVRIAAHTGNLGINTITPTEKLHVVGNARITGAIYDSSNTPGTSGQILSSTGIGTTWIATPAPTPAALTKTDDTNVTLTLGGTPATSLLQGVSLTLGWSGTLADSRITSAAIWNAKQDAITLTTTGTGAATFVANVLNIPTPSLTGFVPYTGATSTVDLNTRDLYTTGKIFVGTTVDPGAAIKFAVSNGNMVIDNNWNFAGKRADGLVLSICKINTSNQLEFNALFGQAITAYLFTFNGTEQMRLTNTGLLGIGTPTPTQKCHVQGNLRVTGQILDSSNVPGTANQILSSTGTGTSWINGNVPYKYNFSGSLTLTGTLTTTNLLTITIPANSLSDYLDLRSLMVQQSGPALGGFQIRVWHNSVNDFNTATRIANYAFGAGGADLFAQMTRKFSIQGGTLFGFSSTPSNATGEGSNSNAALSIPFDPTVTNYLFVSVQLNNVTDTAILRNVNITN